MVYRQDNTLVYPKYFCCIKNKIMLWYIRISYWKVIALDMLNDFLLLFLFWLWKWEMFFKIFLLFYDVVNKLYLYLVDYYWFMQKKKKNWNTRTIRIHYKRLSQNLFYERVLWLHGTYQLEYISFCQQWYFPQWVYSTICIIYLIRKT